MGTDGGTPGAVGAGALPATGLVGRRPGRGARLADGSPRLRLLLVSLGASLVLLVGVGSVLWERQDDRELTAAWVAFGVVGVGVAVAVAASTLRAFTLLGDYVRELERSRIEFRQALTRLGDALAASDRSGIVTVLADTSLLLADADVATFHQAAGSHLELRASAGGPAGDLRRIAFGEGVAGAAAAAGAPVRWPPAPVDPAAGEPAAGSAVAVPVWARGRLYGVLGAYRRVGRLGFDAEDLDDLVAYAHQAEAAIDNTFLYEETRRLSLTDGLTSIWNRRQFDLRCAQELERAHRFGEPFTVLICDLDDFKSVNERFHHPGGDAVLIEFAQRLVATTREVDFVGRYGGEEFVLILPRTDAAGAAVVAEAIRRATCDEPFETGSGPVAVTVSVGLACHPEHGATPQQLVDAADAALFEAKAGGKDAVRTARSTGRHPTGPARAPVEHAGPGQPPRGQPAHEQPAHEQQVDEQQVDEQQVHEQQAHAQQAHEQEEVR